MFELGYQQTVPLTILCLAVLAFVIRWGISMDFTSFSSAVTALPLGVALVVGCGWVLYSWPGQATAAIFGTAVVVAIVLMRRR